MSGKKRNQEEKKRQQLNQKRKNLSKLMERLTYDVHSRAIIFALTQTPVVEGLRYNQLHRTANKIFSEITETSNKMPVKTFNEHLKELVKTKLVERNEISRYEVRYRVKFFDEITQSLARETIRDIKLFQQATEEAWTLLKKMNLSDEETAKCYISHFLNFQNLIALKTLYLGIKLVNDPVHLVFLLHNTYAQIIEHVGLAIYYLSRVPQAAEGELGDFLKGIQEKYESALKPLESESKPE